MPSGSTVGTTHVQHTPTPQAISSSTDTWQATPSSAHRSATARSIPIGPTAYTTAAPVAPTRSSSTSVTRPCVPKLPSSVVKE